MTTSKIINEKRIDLLTVFKQLNRKWPLILVAVMLSAKAFAQAQNAEASMNALGPENSSLLDMVGNWDVTETVWSSPTALPVANNKYVAERRMIGSILQEIMYDKGGSPLKDVERIDYLSFNRVEGRWKYISMDARVPVGLMPAASFTRGEKGKITIEFEPFSMPGTGTEVSGQMLRMDETITTLNPDHIIKEQHFIFADGKGIPFLAHRYEYIRRK